MSVIIVAMMTVVLIPGKSCSRGWGELRTAWVCFYASGFTANITHHPQQDYDQGDLDQLDQLGQIEHDQLDHPHQDYDQGEWSETWLSWRFCGVTTDPRMWCRMQSKVGAIVQLCNCAKSRQVRRCPVHRGLVLLPLGVIRTDLSTGCSPSRRGHN